MSSFKVSMVKVRETKGAVVYQEVDGEGKPVDQSVGMLNTTHVRKLAFADGIPANLNVTFDY